MHHNKNAANEAHVKESEIKGRKQRERELDDLRAVISTLEGRRFVWRILSHCKVFESVWHPSALIHHNSGRQDVGHFVMGELIEARENALIEMMRENKQGE